MPDNEPINLVEVTADLTAAFVSNNNVVARDLPDLISSIYTSLTALGSAPAVEADEGQVRGAVSARKSTSSREHILSMIDGKPYKALTRHIAKNGYTADSYRAAFGLPASYPMTAPAYSEKRSVLAKSIGLGRKAGTKVAIAAKRGRKPKAQPTA